MNINNRLVIFTGALAVLAILSLGSAADAKPGKHHSHSAYKQHYPSYRRTAGGTLIDSEGWRKRDNATGWDNTCFRNLDYLPSMYACGSGRR